EKFDRFYVGHSTDIDKRLAYHNSGKVKSTKAFAPWKVVYSEIFTNATDARSREKYFKSAAGRKFLKPIKDKVRVPRPND
ncbi:MAG: GIY-YIG nuclease family protein, partial [Bacteroidia bacterium]